MSNAKKDITSIFNKFAGREVPMIETLQTLPRRRPEHPVRTYLDVTPVNPNDPTLADMHKAAADNGLQLDIYWAGGSGARPVCFGSPPENYVIAYIEKESDGKWRVSKKLTLSKDLQP